MHSDRSACLLEEIILVRLDSHIREVSDLPRIGSEVARTGRTRVLARPAVDIHGCGPAIEEFCEVVCKSGTRVSASAVHLADHDTR